jgi:hypothetical protein
MSQFMRWFLGLWSQDNEPKTFVQPSLKTIEEWERKSLDLRISLAQDRLDLSNLREQWEILNQKVSDDIQRAEEADRLHQVAIDALRSENQVMRDITVPELVAAHKLILQRYDAETAIEIRRQVAAGGGGNLE